MSITIIYDQQSFVTEEILKISQEWIWYFDLQAKISPITPYKINLSMNCFYEMFEDTNGLIRHRKWKKDRKYNGKANKNNNKKRQTMFDGTLH